MEKIIGIGEAGISENEGDVLKTFALSSCVALTVYSPTKKVAAMAHIALPSPSNPENGNSRPYYYAVTAVPFLINRMINRYKCSKEELQIKIFGGADSVRENDMFQVGRKNLETVKNILLDMGLKFDSKKTGERFSRTIEMNVATGEIKLYELPLKI